MSDRNQDILNALRDRARAAEQHAYVPFSGDPEAAVLLLEDGTWIPGVRVESATFSLSIPPLLNAYTTAVTLGHQDIVAAVLNRPLRPAERVFLDATPHASFQQAGPDAYVKATSLPKIRQRLSPFLEASAPETPTEGIRQARAVAEGAYVPASRFPVGCILTTADGRCIPGVNVEHPDWMHILCAERNALGTAYSYGYTDLDALYLSCPTDPAASPCGACRQLLVELAPEATLWMDRGSAPPDKAHPDSLLPGSFSGQALARRA